MSDWAGIIRVLAVALIPNLEEEEIGKTVKDCLRELGDPDANRPPDGPRRKPKEPDRGGG